MTNKPKATVRRSRKMSASSPTFKDGELLRAIGRRIASARNAAGLSLKGLSDRLAELGNVAVSATQIARIEDGAVLPSAFERHYRAIDCLGRSLHRLFKQESKDTLVRALLLLSHAYQRVGLFWAARGALLTAASVATSEFWIYNTINTAQLMCYDQLRYVESQLGRIGAALEWHAVNPPIHDALRKLEEMRKRLSKS